MARKVQRPISPHLQVYRFQYTMATSILHRFTGAALTGGAVLLTCWLAALSVGGLAYDIVQWFIDTIIGRLALFGFTVSLYYHLANGVRHLIWDLGHGFALKSAELGAYVVFGTTAVLTLITWIIGFLHLYGKL